MLTWALHELTQTPEYMARIVAEADGVFGKGNGPATKLPAMEQLNNLVFSQCCLKVRGLPMPCRDRKMTEECRNRPASSC